MRAGTGPQLWTCSTDTTNQQWLLKGSEPGAAAPADSQSSNAGTGDYLRTSGTNIVDNNNLGGTLRGTNISGWLVTEG